MDNTYFATITIDVLGNWADYPSERTAIINYINSLQSNNPFEWYFGGFENDNESSFESLHIFEPNILTSYYSVKTLNVFNMVGSINVANFNQYLGGLYNDTSDFFDFTYYPFSTIETQANIIGSAMGLELSDLSGLPAVDSQKVIDFILYNRNSNELWYESTDEVNCDLIYTFQIIRSLNEVGEIAQLNQTTKDEISDRIEFFSSYDAYALFSEDYMSIDLIYSIVSSFNLYDRINDLNLVEIYNQIRGLYKKIQGSFDYSELRACTSYIFNRRQIRSYPIEYYNTNQEYASHKTTFIALSALKSLFILDDFEFDCNVNLTAITEEIVNSQLLQEGYSNHGAFLPSLGYIIAPSDFQNSRISFEYSFYAIKTLEFIADYAGLNFTNFDLNKAALYGYITRNRLIFQMND